VESVGLLVSFGGAAVGPLAAGFAYSAFGGRTTVALLAAWTLALAIVGTISRSLRGLEEAEAQPA
jgi:hypothetical protein